MECAPSKEKKQANFTGFYTDGKPEILYGLAMWTVFKLPGGTPKKIGWVCASQNLTLFMTKICNVRPPYLRPDQKLDNLFMTVASATIALNLSYEGILLMVLSIMIKKKLLILTST